MDLKSLLPRYIYFNKIKWYNLCVFCWI